MSTLFAHRDSIEGRAVSLVLNTPYDTLCSGNTIAKSRGIQAFSRKENGDYAKIISDTVWVSPIEGLLVSAFIEQHLDSWDISENHFSIYLPLDHAIYTVECSEFGASGDESIISYDDHLERSSHIPVYVIKGGALTEHFIDSELLDAPIDSLISNYRFRSMTIELLRNKLFTFGHFVTTGVAASLVAFTAFFVAPSLFSNEAPIIEQVQQALVPKGNDFAVNQLIFVDGVLSDGLSYFLYNGLESLVYSTDNGITVKGAMPSTDSLESFIADAENAGLALSLSNNGWSVNKWPELQRRQLFELTDFNDSILALSRIQSLLEYQVSMESPKLNASSRTATVRLSKTLNSPPDLLPLAEMLAGHPSIISELEITFDDYSYAFIQITLTITGTKQ